MVHFQWLEANAPMPLGYRLATTQDVKNHKQGLLKACAWEIVDRARDFDDWIPTPSRGKVRSDICNKFFQKLTIYDSQGTTLVLFGINDNLPPEYRLATIFDAWANPQALRAAMPAYEIANLANGSVDGASYGCNIRSETRDDAGQKLAALENAASGPPPKFQMFKVGDQLPPTYHLATRFVVESNEEALFEAMPGSEIANLADGSVAGAFYGGLTSPVQRKDVRYKLAELGVWIS